MKDQSSNLNDQPPVIKTCVKITVTTMNLCILIGFLATIYLMDRSPDHASDLVILIGVPALTIILVATIPYLVAPILDRYESLTTERNTNEA